VNSQRTRPLSATQERLALLLALLALAAGITAVVVAIELLRNAV
jgi:hypothetical protein